MVIAANEYRRYSTIQPQEQTARNFRNELEVTRH